MKPSFAKLNESYPRREPLPREALLASIGWSDVLFNPAFLDTCALRMSLTLVGSGVTLPGARMRVKAGALKGNRIEPGQAKLSRILKQIWGAPDVYRSEISARDGIAKQSGVASFFKINGGATDGGHIDLIWPGANGFSSCAMSCYFKSSEIWFWPVR